MASVKKEPKQKHIPKTNQKLGQFYTTNYSYILQGLTIPENIQTIIEPFAGNGDLLEFIKTQTHIKQPTLECYDIDPKQYYIVKRDTISNPPDYKNKYLLTNPPYLARNKSDEKHYLINMMLMIYINVLLKNSLFRKNV